MYKDIISYELAESMTKEKLTKVAGRIVNEWMKKLPGFVKWEIHSGPDLKMTDIVYWESKEAAKNAEQEMRNIPDAGEWMSCYKPGTISSSNITLVADF